MTQSATNFRGGARKILGKKRSRTCKKKQQGGNSPLSSMLGQSHMIKCKIVEAGEAGESDTAGVTFSPAGSAKGQNLTALKQMLLKDKAFMSKLAPKGVGGPSDDPQAKKAVSKAKKDDSVKDLGKTGRYTVPYTKDPGAQMQIIRSFEDKFFSDKKGYVFQRRYSGNSMPLSKSRYTKEEPNKGSYFMRLIILLFMIKIFKKELDEHETKDFGVSERNNVISEMNIVHSQLPSYSGKRSTFTSFYSLFAPLYKDYSNATPIYEELENLFSTENTWLDSAKGAPYRALIEIINDDFFNDVYDSKQDAKEKARVFKYKLLLFISYYNKIVNEEGKSIGKYDGERKIINDMKYALIGERGKYGGDTGVTTYSQRGYSITNSLQYMLWGLKKMDSGITLDNNSIIKYGKNRQQPAVIGEANHTFESLKEKINDVKPEAIQSNEKLPFSGKKNSNDEIQITNLQSGGTSNNVNEDVGPIYVLGALVEGHAVLKKRVIGQEKDYDAGPNTMTVKHIKNFRKIILSDVDKSNQLSEVLKLYIKKYFEIVTKVYYPAILAGKGSVGIYKAMGNKGGEDYVRARVGINRVQADLLVLNTYLSRISMPDENEIPADENEIGYTSEHLKNIFEKYNVKGDELNVLKVNPVENDSPFARKKEEVANLFTEKENFADRYEVLRKMILENIMNEYNAAFTNYNEEAKKLDESLNGTNEGLKQFLESKNFRTRLENNDRAIIGLHNYFLNEQASQAGQDGQAGGADTPAASSADADPAASSADTAATVDPPAASRPEYKPLTPEKIMLPKKLPNNIVGLLEVQKEYIGIKNAEQPDLTKEAISFNPEQIESLQKAVQKNSEAKDSSKGSKELVEQKVLISTYGEALKKMGEYVEELKQQLDNQNRLTKTLLTAVFDELDKKIEELKQLLNKKDDMDTIKSKFKQLINLWRRTIGPIENEPMKRNILNMALFKYQFLNNDAVKIEEKFTLGEIVAAINSLEFYKKESADLIEVPLSFFIDYDGAEKKDKRNKFVEDKVNSEIAAAEKEVLTANNQLINEIDNLIREDKFKQNFAIEITAKINELKKDKTFKNQFKKQKRLSEQYGYIKQNYFNKIVDGFGLTGLELDDNVNCEGPNASQKQCNKLPDMLAYGLKVPGYTDLQIKMGEEKPEKLKENLNKFVINSQAGGGTNDDYEKLFNDSIKNFEEAVKKVDAISTAIIAGNDPDITELTDKYKSQVLNPIIKKINEETTNLSDGTLTHIKKNLFNFPNMKDFNSELEKNINEANNELKAKVKKAQEDKEKAKALVESAKQVKKIIELVKKQLDEMQKKNDLGLAMSLLISRSKKMEGDENNDITKEELIDLLDSFIGVDGCPDKTKINDGLQIIVKEKQIPPFVLIPEKDGDIDKQSFIFEYFTVICQNKDAEITDFLKNLRDKVSESYKDQVKGGSDFAKVLDEAETEKTRLETEKARLETEIEEKHKEIEEKHKEIQEAATKIADEELDLDSLTKKVYNLTEETLQQSDKVNRIQEEVNKLQMEVEGLRTNIQKLQEDITAIQKGGEGGEGEGPEGEEEKKKDEAANIIQKAAQERFEKLIASETLVNALKARIQSMLPDLNEKLKKLEDQLKEKEEGLGKKSAELATNKSALTEIEGKKNSAEAELSEKTKQLQQPESKDVITKNLFDIKNLEKEKTANNKELQKINEKSLPDAEKNYLLLKDKKEAFENGVSVFKYRIDKRMGVFRGTAKSAAVLSSKLTENRKKKEATKAAAKIQAVQRGKKVREEQAAKAEAQEEAESLIEQTKAATKAATKIQAVAKGNKTRKVLEAAQGEKIDEFLQDFEGGKKMRKAIKKALGKSTMKKRPVKKSNKKKSDKKKPEKKRTMNRRIRIRKRTLKK